MRTRFRLWTRKPRPRLLWITSEYNPRVGGLEKSVEQTMAALSVLADVGLITDIGQHPKPGETVRQVGALNLKGCRTEPEFQATSAELHRICKDFQPDMIHLASGGLACFAELLCDVAPVFCTVHCKDITAPWQRIPGADVRAAIAAGLECCARVFCVSNYTLGHLARMAPGAVGETLTPGLPRAFFGATMGRASYFTPEGGIPRILTVARLAPRKGHGLLLEALQAIKRPFVWDIVGTGPIRDEFEARLKSSAIYDSTVMHGALNDEQLAVLFRQCDVFALTPTEVLEGNGIDAEGFGLVYLEAAAYGKPSVGSASGGCGEAIDNSRTGFTVDPCNSNGLALSIERLLASFSLRQSMGSAAFHRAKSDFCVEDRATTLMRRYMEHGGR